MRTLILGGAGMLGHKMFQTFSERYPETTWCTVREEAGDPLLERVDLFRSDRVVRGVDAMRIDALEGLVGELRPDAVINCIGVIKQRGAAKEAIPSITVNSLLPHGRGAAAARHGGRLVHFSTDCVFSGRKGDYRESDAPDAEDLYGRSKLLGEASDENALTLRTSIIGRELRTHRSLLDWFLSQAGGRVSGYRRVWWSGVTTNHLSELVASFLERHPDLSGVYQLAGRKINKYDLLLALREAYGVEVEVVPDDQAVLDRSLVGERLREATGYEPPAWDALLADLAADPTPYDRWTGKSS
jgi:dTDP-4-dehydrorhamnose reductase